jgi:hypothetical protein
VAELIDKEIGAIKAVLRALEPLSAEIRANCDILSSPQIEQGLESRNV